MSKSIDASICPICGGSNHCAEINPQHKIDGRCWCAHETFPPGIFELVPEEKLNKACICRDCLEKYKSGRLRTKEGEYGL